MSRKPWALLAASTLLACLLVLALARVRNAPRCELNFPAASSPGSTRTPDTPS
jgi:hypothetical protein